MAENFKLIDFYNIINPHTTHTHIHALNTVSSLTIFSQDPAKSIGYTGWGMKISPF